MPPHILLLLMALLCPAPGRVAAQSVPPQSMPPQSVPAAPGADADSTAIAQLARDLVAAAPTDSARAAAIYEWVARNIAYDVAGYLAGRIDGESAEAVFRRRVAVCGGYVALFARLGREAGLETATISGYAKGFDYEHGRARTSRDNHAWLAVRIDGRWRLVDPTWGAGAVSSGEFVPSFSWAWFLVAPDELVLSHFPRQSRWQLVARPLSRREFERMAAVPRSLLDIGFSPAALRAAARSAAAHGFPEVALPGGGARVVTAPLAGRLAREAPFEIDVLWPGATEVLLVSGGVWTPLGRTGDRFSGSTAVAAGPLWVVGRTGTAADGFSTLLHYQVD
jgi:hypothetical protein